MRNQRVGAVTHSVPREKPHHPAGTQNTPLGAVGIASDLKGVSVSRGCMCGASGTATPPLGAVGAGAPRTARVPSDYV